MLSVSKLVFVFVGLAFIALPTTTVKAVSLPDFNKLNKASVEFRVIKNSPELENFYKNSGLIPVSRSGAASPLVYTFGTRDESNDELITEGSGMKFAFPAQNLQMRLKYEPEDEDEEALITRVEIKIYQNSTKGRAYIVSGGIGQRDISIRIEAGDVSSMRYSFKIYGTKINKDVNNTDNTDNTV